MILLMVGLGGLVGAVLRYSASTWVQGLFEGGFPFGTLAVNVVGCLAIGLVVGYADGRRPLNTEVQAFLMVGVLGGFTTFSAFGIDTINLLRGGDYFGGVMNVALQLGVGLAAVVVGLRLAEWGFERVASGQ